MLKTEGTSFLRKILVQPIFLKKGAQNDAKNEFFYIIWNFVIITCLGQS